MRRATQGLLLAFVGAVLLRLSISDAYLRYVNDWMKWPIVVSGVLLVLMSLGPLFGSRDEDASVDDDDHDRDDPAHEHAEHERHSGVPYVTWLLVLPGLVAFAISPPALGAFLAERRSNETVVAPEPAVVADLATGETVPLAVEEFIWRAQELPETLVGQAVEMTGFVSYDGQGGWYVTRMSIACCAADASAYQVEVEGADRPTRDSWVSVSGVWVEGTGTDDRGIPVVQAASVAEVEAPNQTYQ